MSSFREVRGVHCITISSRWWEPATEKYSGQERVVSQQLALKYCSLRLDHAIEIQLTTASKGKVLRQIRATAVAKAMRNGILV